MGCSSAFAGTLRAQIAGTECVPGRVAQPWGVSNTAVNLLSQEEAVAYPLCGALRGPTPPHAPDCAAPAPSLPAEETGSAPKTIVYHLGEGVYGIFNSVLFDNTCPTPVLPKVSQSHVGLCSVVWVHLFIF